MDSAEWTASDLEIAKSLNSKIKKLNQIIIEGTIKELTENGFVIDCNNGLFSVISLYPVVATKKSLTTRNFWRVVNLDRE